MWWQWCPRGFDTPVPHLGHGRSIAPMVTAVARAVILSWRLSSSSLMGRSGEAGEASSPVSRLPALRDHAASSIKAEGAIKLGSLLLLLLLLLPPPPPRAVRALLWARQTGHLRPRAWGVNSSRSVRRLQDMHSACFSLQCSCRKGQSAGLQSQTVQARGAPGGVGLATHSLSFTA